MFPDPRNLPAYDRFSFPSTTEEASIRSFISTAENEIAKLEQTIAGLRSSVALQKSIIAPVRRLPPELLSHIFVVADASTMGERLSRQTKNLVIGVNAAWRAVALSTPSLWSKILLDGAVQHMDPSRKVNSLLSRQLKLSGQYPLTITYISYGHNFSLRGCLALLLEHAHHWKDVYLHLGDDDDEIFQTSSVAFPLLERLDVAGSGDIYAAPAAVDLTLRCPKISRLGLSLYSDLSPKSLLVPWTRLASVKLHAEPQFIQETLDLAHQLTSAELYPMRTLPSDLQQTRRVEHPRLSVLKIHNQEATLREDDYLHHLFSLLQAPALRELDFEPNAFKREELDLSITSSLLSFISSSRCSLTRLNYRGDADQQAFLKILSLVPTLEYLTFAPQFNDIPFSFIRSLIRSGSDTLLPALIALELDGKLEDERDLRADIERMLHSRNAATGAGTLRSFFFCWTPQKTDPVPLLAIPGLRVSWKKIGVTE
ncbi:F-box domain-containing protein [Mycena chlorophos]|uniref:F-box domain-containing protein n=1 Tax=Mycena chlorophos TaxID=658473 RepID=A0A8H6WLC8_MYCCL|nr:F-box domain-containing protein [Mycena chlorophos]